MKTHAILAAALLAFAAHGATSDILFPVSGGTLSDVPGNVAFNGEQFVTPVVHTNGRIFLTYLDTNAVAISNLSAGANGNSPRIVFNGLDCVLAWLDTNGVENVLRSQGISQGVSTISSAIATNVAEESISLSRLGDQVLAVWQSAGSNSAVLGRLLNLDGEPGSDIFPIAPSALPQRYPSVDNDGSSHLVCWMQQNSETNDWGVLARRIVDGAPNGSLISVSETNSMWPYRTACSFGTNYLVVWSADEGPWEIETNLFGFEGLSNLWRPTVHGRMLSELGMPLRHEFSMLRFNHFTTNVAVAFGEGQYLVTCYSDGVARQPGQVLNADGERHGPSFMVWEQLFSPHRPSVAFGAGRFCVTYAYTNQAGVVRIVKGQTLPDMKITGVHRLNDSIGLTVNSASGVSIQVSTNLLNWEDRMPWALPSLGGRPQLYVRLSYHAWTCIENLRTIDDAKQNWAFSNFRSSVDVPTVADLFPPGVPVPTCPSDGSYSIQRVANKPTCSIASHTL